MSILDRPLGHRRWAIGDGYIPQGSHGPAPEMTSHESVSILNTNDEDAQIRLTLFFEDREPASYWVTVPAERTVHQRINDLKDPEVPRGLGYSAVIESDLSVVVQHTRLDSRQAECALLSTIAFAATD